MRITLGLVAILGIGCALVLVFSGRHHLWYFLGSVVIVEGIAVGLAMRRVLSPWLIVALTALALGFVLMAGFRDLLKRPLSEYQLLFDVGAAVILGFMAIALAIEANRLASKQTDLVNRQTIIAEQELRPRFHFRLTRQWHGTGEELNKFDELLVFNNGAMVRELRFERAAFLELERVTPEGTETRHVPFWYFGNYVYSYEPTGLVATLSALLPAHTFVQELNVTGQLGETVEELEAREDVQMVRPRFFLVLDYWDLLGKRHRDHFEVVLKGWIWDAPDAALSLDPTFGERVQSEFHWRSHLNQAGLGRVVPQAKGIFDRWEEWPALV